MATATTAPTLASTNPKLNRRKKGVARGNSKTGKVITYSRTPGATCPGKSEWCTPNCLAQVPYKRWKDTKTAWDRNSTDAIPELPKPRKDGKPIPLRIHVGGDFDTRTYIHAWRFALEARPDVQAWAYTRSWATDNGRAYSDLIPDLEKLAALPNVQLFASCDPTMIDPPAGWRVATIADVEVGTDTARIIKEPRFDGAKFPVCMEQTGKSPDSAECGYCFTGTRGNITFFDTKIKKELRKAGKRVVE